MEASVDSSSSPTEPAVANKGTAAPAPAARSSFKEALSSSKEPPSKDVLMDGSKETDGTPTRTKLITLSSLSDKRRDVESNRTISTGKVRF